MRDPDTQQQDQAPAPTAASVLSPSASAAAEVEPETEPTAAPPTTPDLPRTYTVRAGQGFDLIAAEIYERELERAPTAAEVVLLSSLIARNNKNDRNYSSGYIHPDQALSVPNLIEMQEQAQQNNKSLADYITDLLAGQN